MFVWLGGWGEGGGGREGRKVRRVNLKREPNLVEVGKYRKLFPKGPQGDDKRRSTNKHFRHFFDWAPLGVPWGAPGSPKDANRRQMTPQGYQNDTKIDQNDTKIIPKLLNKCTKLCTKNLQRNTTEKQKTPKTFEQTPLSQSASQPASQSVRQPGSQSASHSVGQSVCR